MLSLKRLRSPLAVAALLAAVYATPALACPPWISVELPVNPFASEARGAFLLVHAYHGCHAGQLSVSGTAEGLVKGERRSIPLEVAPTATVGLYLVRRQWPGEGVWILNLTVQEGDGHATALVRIGASGTVTAVRVPTLDGRVARTVSDADIEAMLHALAPG